MLKNIIKEFHEQKCSSSGYHCRIYTLKTPEIISENILESLPFAPGTGVFETQVPIRDFDKYLGPVIGGLENSDETNFFINKVFKELRKKILENFVNLQKHLKRNENKKLTDIKIGLTYYKKDLEIDENNFYFLGPNEKSRVNTLLNILRYPNPKNKKKVNFQRLLEQRPLIEIKEHFETTMRTDSYIIELISFLLYNPFVNGNIDNQIMTDITKMDKFNKQMEFLQEKTFYPGIIKYRKKYGEKVIEPIKKIAEKIQEKSPVNKKFFNQENIKFGELSDPEQRNFKEFAKYFYIHIDIFADSKNADKYQISMTDLFVYYFVKSLREIIQINKYDIDAKIMQKANTQIQWIKDNVNKEKTISIFYDEDEFYGSDFNTPTSINRHAYT